MESYKASNKEIFLGAPPTFSIQSKSIHYKDRQNEYLVKK